MPLSPQTRVYLGAAYAEGKESDLQSLDVTACLDISLKPDYRVFVRLVGKPNTGIGVTTCATEDVLNTETGLNEDMIVCSTENVVRIRNKGKVATFEDVSKQLLTICLDTYDDGNFDGNCDVRYSLLSTELENYFWQWNTQGKAHAQLVFIPTP